jgi:hypothetical protein
MQTIKLLPGFEKIISEDLFVKISSENDFVYLENNILNISYNLDVSDMYGSSLGEDEDEFNEFLSSFFYMTFPKLTKYFVGEFEIIFFTYSSEYTADMWKFDGKKLYNSSGWIGDFCIDCEEDSNQDEFVDNNYLLLKEGNPTEELIIGLRSALKKV